MKKLLFIITGLLLLFSVEGQILRYSNYTVPAPSEILVESIDVFGTGGATTISTYGGTLQMLKKTLPSNATDTTATWSRINGSGTASISGTGLLTALTDGTVTARATANDGSAIYGDEVITISNQTVSAPSFLTSDGYTQGWYRFADSVVQTGNAVRRWGDFLNSAHDLLQATSGSQPTLTANGILFDGSDDYMKTATFTLNPPLMVYAVIKHVTFQAYEYIWDGNGLSTFVLADGTATPNIYINHGDMNSADNGNLAVDTWAIVRVTEIGGATYVGTLTVNGTTTTTLDADYAENPAGFTLGGDGTGASNSNIEVKEIIIRSQIDSGSNQALVYNYLNAKYSLGLTEL